MLVTLGAIDAQGQAMIPQLVAMGIDPRIINLIVQHGGTDQDLAGILAGDDTLTVFARLMGWSIGEAKLAFDQATANSVADAIAATQRNEAAEQAQTPAQAIASATIPPPVSAQSSPTPQVTAPSPPSPNSVLVTSGGGTASPAPTTASPAAITPSPTTSTLATPASTSLADRVSAWMGGSTAIGGMPISNVVLSGGILLGALLLFGDKKRRK